MNFHGKDIKIFACNSNLPVAKQMADRLGLTLGQADVKHFSDGEIAVSFLGLHKCFPPFVFL